MRMYDIIERKRDGHELSCEEIAFAVSGYVAGDIPDYQISALLMAIFLQGMTDAETTALTLAMMNSGDVVDLSELPGASLDKHSTGGVGDKTSLAIVPMLMAMTQGRAFVAKMSGRGLGHTGGTLDKLESIPGFRIGLSHDEFMQTLRKHGGAIVGQTGSLVPADKLIYALRDVTATVNSIPLIASSIMSKKLAAGATSIVLDVKVGSGAFMKTVPEAINLARTMVAIGTAMGRQVKALITNMNRPLGTAIGNALEIAEVVEVLHGQGPDDLRHEAIMLCRELMALAKLEDAEQAELHAQQVLDDGSAFDAFCTLCAAQGGDTSVLHNTALLPQATCCANVYAPLDGYLGSLDTERIGIASLVMGAGRATKDDAIDYAAGIRLLKHPGDAVHKGNVIAELYASSKEKLSAGEAELARTISIVDTQPAPEPLLYAMVDTDGVHLEPAAEPALNNSIPATH
ncbi:thymidine phosphorylase [Collinsella sp. zg1085]|uniref:thymidine phosphorylase n=1 Tax=Collinsella sp. zg1085 TaxID=2844380 RepID=UPI001C0BE5FD|nr:thymidine phosphorylase [Collinsella sp. zg1085]QWT17401.1 thymidine phosphorylase [Collinsella sp. zg1085]